MASNDPAAIVRQHYAVARDRGYLRHFIEASREYGIPVEILLAIGSRETAMGTSPNLRADGSNGRGMVGIMQMNRRYHPVNGNDHRAVIRRAAWYLAGELRRAYAAWNYRLAGYNAGPYGARLRSLFRRRLAPDPVTDGGNYPTDVLRRAAIMREMLAQDTAAPRLSTSTSAPATLQLTGGGSSLAPLSLSVATLDTLTVASVDVEAAYVGDEDWAALAAENAALEREAEIPQWAILAAVGAGVYLVTR